MTTIRESRNDRIFKAFIYSFLIVILIIVLYPLIYIISASISDPTLVSSGKMWLWPKGINFDGYKLIFQDDQIWIGYLNTIYYTVLGVLISLAITLPAAYALSRRKLVGGNFFMMMFAFTMFFSGGLVPTYLLVKNLGLVNTVGAMVLPNAAAVWNIIVCRTFFQVTIPKELEEAAIIDGCSTTKLFFKVVIPLSMPIIAVMALFYGVGQWNDYFNALIYLSDKEKYPLQMILRQILVLQELGNDNMATSISNSAAEAMQHSQSLADIMKYAIIIVSTLPMIIVYPFLQRFFVKGVMIGSIKG
ncbi:putative aldouronate transport system permease protein [Pullulanibacillus pueri]|uniref:Sugar ABC transporter permease n=1 Tax=Pullulanibacillus pueri TaxID=1437324 RepID=A0A8J3ELG6_9BACL|nr:carbohydrate ABC transporter permease [Pullulanibacillus pueri]MBM7681653.1 putative aldouronate transport system permease protein [Pullulanibacillus pueri]GGH79298.1 sugar ABC transporter permease [Pullulanibacillus pueri]